MANLSRSERCRLSVVHNEIARRSARQNGVLSIALGLQQCSKKVFTLILLKHRSSSLKCSARRIPNLHQEEWRLLYLASVFDITDFFGRAKNLGRK